MNPTPIVQSLYLNCTKGVGLGSVKELPQPLTDEQWREFFRLCKQQGVLAIVYASLMSLPKEYQPSRDLKLRWALSAENIAQRYDMQLNISAYLADEFAKHGLKTVVMKGFAIGTYYPNPKYRECGDLDCFLGDGHELGNQICEQMGAKVSRDYYKDSTIKYRGLMVENHRFFLPVRGSRQVKALERHLRSIVFRDGVNYVPGTKLIIPSADFNALYLTAHGLNHFLSEGIKLRHILDWALLLKAEQNNINWAEFYYWADRLHMTRFANALTTIAVEHLGLQITNPAVVTSSPYADMILRDTLFGDNSLYNRGYSRWKVRFMLVHNRLSCGWKYHKIYQRSVLLELLRNLYGFLFDRDPKL